MSELLSNTVPSCLNWEVSTFEGVHIYVCVCVEGGGSYLIVWSGGCFGVWVFIQVGVM